MKHFNWNIKFVVLLLAMTSMTSQIHASPLNLSMVDEQDVAVYAAVERLVSFGLIDKIIEGQRPWSRTEVARLIQEAKTHLDRLHDVRVEVEAKETLAFLTTRFEKELNGISEVKVYPLTRASVEYMYLDSPIRFVPANVGTGDQIDAFINPLTSYRKGRSFADTHNFGLETRHEVDLTKYFAATGTPNFLFRELKGTPDYVQVGFDELYARGEFANIGIQLGRDTLAWGQMPQGGLTGSINTTPLDMFKISNVHPFHLPWIFKYLGATQLGYYFAVEGSNREHPYPYVTGMKFSFQPARNFEFGLNTSVIAGGKGGPQSSLSGRVADLFGFVGVLANHDPNISDRVGGADFLIRIPSLRALEFYYEIMFEDTQSISHWDTMFTDYAIQQFGFFLPRLNVDGTQTLRLEGAYSGFRVYRHFQYTSGWTNNRRIMGSELGPDGKSVLLSFDSRPTSHFHQTHSIAVENRGSDLYALLNNATDVVITQHNPSETRYRWVSSFGLQYHPSVAWNVSAGYERVNQFDFIPGQNRNNFMVDFKANFYPQF
ncbi:MAG: capsule assembly Wzi family protein [Deltaproteobacteria bacterium]|nr:capsule assembly Wzi family protein [Deltaproteobacteria bacterium]